MDDTMDTIWAVLKWVMFVTGLLAGLSFIGLMFSVHWLFVCCGIVSMVALMMCAGLTVCVSLVTVFRALNDIISRK